MRLNIEWLIDLRSSITNNYEDFFMNSDSDLRDLKQKKVEEKNDNNKKHNFHQ